MGTWLSNISLKYKFWAVNAVAFVTTLLLVLYAVQLEQQSRSNAAQANARAQTQLLSAWPAGQPLPEASQLLPLAPDQIASVNDQALPQLGNANGWVSINPAVVRPQSAAGRRGTDPRRRTKNRRAGPYT